MIKVLENQIEWYNKVYVNSKIELVQISSTTKFNNISYGLYLTRNNKTLDSFSLISKKVKEEAYNDCALGLINQLVEIALNKI